MRPRYTITSDGVIVRILPDDQDVVMYEAVFQLEKQRAMMVRNLFRGPDGNLLVKNVALPKKVRKMMFAVASRILLKKRGRNDERVETELGGCGCMFFSGGGTGIGDAIQQRGGNQ